MDFTTCLLFTLLSMIASSLALYDLEKQPKKCQEQKSYQMLGYFCNNLNLDTVPKKMRSSIEVRFDVQKKLRIHSQRQTN